MSQDHRTAMEEGYEKDMLDKLAMLARGHDIYGRSVSAAEMMAAQKQYHELKHQIDTRRIAREKLNNEKTVEESRLATQRELEHRRLDIEEEKVKVQKAEVIVKALEVAVQGGADPQQLLLAIQGLSQNLLAGPADTSVPLLLEKK